MTGPGIYATITYAAVLLTILVWSVVPLLAIVDIADAADTADTNPCGHACACTNLTILCSNYTLKHVPTFPRGVVHITIDNTQIEYVGSGQFKNLSGSLSQLELRNNPIRSIGKEAFTHLANLKKLTISSARKLTTFPDLSGTNALEHLRIDRLGLALISPTICQWAPKLKSLIVKSNRITALPILDGCTQLQLIDLSYNEIVSLGSRPFFSRQAQLIDLFLGHNSIKEIPASAFQGLSSLQVLELENNGIEYIHPDAFEALQSLRDLNLGRNSFANLPTKGLQNLRQIKTHNNPALKDFPEPYTFPKLQSLAVSYAYHCCQFLPVRQAPTYRPPSLQETILWLQKEDIDVSLWSANHSQVWGTDGKAGLAATAGTDGPAGNNGSKLAEIYNSIWKSYGGKDYQIPDSLMAQYAEEYFEQDYKSALGNQEDSNLYIRYPVQCVPQPGPFMPCEDLFGWWTLRCGVWVVFLLALLGNGVVVIVLLFGRSKMDVPRFLVCNLAIADFFMGFYLGILAGVDMGTLGEFKAFAIPWQTSWGCQLAGFLAVLSSELSVYTLAVITLERNYAITHAMHLNKRLSLKHASYIMAVGWSFALAMALMPLLGISDYRKFAVCLPFEIEDSSWSMAYVVFLILINGVAFFVLMGCYLRMYCAIRGSQAWNSNDSRIAKRMALLVFTDFLCWAPIAFFSLTAVSGLHLISLEQAKVFTIFVLPLNSCANPFLYAIFTKQFKKDCVLLCKRIEESRVTRGIGRCRHSSNFSNRHTPANTNSAVEKRSGSGTHSEHLMPIVCQCGIAMTGLQKLPLDEHLLIGAGTSPLLPLAVAGGSKAVPPARTLSTADRFREMATKWFRRKATASRLDSTDSTSCPSSNLAAGGGAELLNKRASSITSDNFSSRSDSWRQHNIPLRLLEQHQGTAAPSTARRTSWAAGKQLSHDSSLSSSRQDSSTFRTSTTRSSVSSSGSKPNSSLTDSTSAGSSSGYSGHHPARTDRANKNNLPTTATSATSNNGADKQQPSIIRQDAIHTGSRAAAIGGGGTGRTRSAAATVGPGGRFMCPDCVRKEIVARDAQLARATSKNKDLEQKLHHFFNKLTESSQEENSELSSKEEPAVVSTDQSTTGDSNKENLSLSRDTNDTSLDISLSSALATSTAAPPTTIGDTGQTQPTIEILPHSPFGAAIVTDEAGVDSRESNFLFADEDLSRTPSSLSVRTQIAANNGATPEQPGSRSVEDISKCRSLTSIGSGRTIGAESATETGGSHKQLHKARRVAGSDNSLKMSLKNFPAMFRSFSSQSTTFLNRRYKQSGSSANQGTSSRHQQPRSGAEQQLLRRRPGHYSAGDMRMDEASRAMSISKSSEAIRTTTGDLSECLIKNDTTDQSDIE